MFTIKSPKPGNVLELYVQDGDRVQRASKLLTIDTEAEQAELSRLEARIAAFQAVRDSLSVTNEKQQVEEIRAKLDANLLELEASNSAYKLVRDEFIAGQYTRLDLSNSIQGLYSARLSVLQTKVKLKYIISDFNDRRRATDIILRGLEEEREYWKDEVSRLTITAPGNGRIRLFVGPGSPIKLSGLIGTIEPE